MVRIARVCPAMLTTVADVIKSARLDLVALSADVLWLIETGDRTGVAAALGAAVDAAWPATVPAQRRRRQMVADPAQRPWLARAMVLRSQERVVGTVGFHGRPDSRGRVEIGYWVLPGHRRRGYAAEAAVALTQWASSTGEVDLCVATIAPDNTASQALATSLGFEQAGEWWDPEDGLGLVFHCRLPLLSWAE